MAKAYYRPKHEDACAMLTEEKTRDSANVYDIINVTRRALARAELSQGELDEYFDEATALYVKESPNGKPHALRALIDHARHWCFVAVPVEWQRELDMLPVELD